MRRFWDSVKLYSVLGKDTTVTTDDRSRKKSVRCITPSWPFKNDLCTFLPISRLFLLFCFGFFFFYLFLFGITSFFLFHRRWPPKWPLFLLLLYYCACFLLYYLVHLPASYLARRYVSLVWHSLIFSVACCPAVARSFFQELSFVGVFPDRCNSLLKILGLNWDSPCKFSGFNTH